MLAQHGHSWDTKNRTLPEGWQDWLRMATWTPDLVPWITPVYVSGASGKFPITERDNSNLLAWTFNAAKFLGCDVFIDREYFYSQALNIPEGVRVFGRGPDKPGLTMLADVVLDRMRQDKGNFAPRWACATEEQLKLGLCPPTITHAAGAKNITIENLQINGGISRIDWAMFTMGYADLLNKKWVYDNSDKWDHEQVSKTLKNAPVASGLNFSKQNGRPTEDLEITLNNVHCHDFLGSCMLVSEDARVNSTRLRLGNSVAGRVLYYACGTHRDLRLYGFGRSSIARLPQPMLCEGCQYRYESYGKGSMKDNPWPENDVPINVIGTDSINDDGRHPPLTIHDIDIDVTGSPFQYALKLGVDCEIDGYVVGGVMQHDERSDDLSIQLRLSGKPVIGTFAQCDLRRFDLEYVR